MADYSASTLFIGRLILAARWDWLSWIRWLIAKYIIAAFVGKQD
jgi:hypothetical protein